MLHLRDTSAAGRMWYCSKIKNKSGNIGIRMMIGLMIVFDRIG